MAVKCSDIMNLIEELSPSKYAYEWDNVGLIIGKKDKNIDKIMVALDATESVVDEAIKIKADMIITHHPIIFKGIKKITSDDFIGRKIMKLIENEICLYSLHTNYDTVGSLSELLAQKLNLLQPQLLDITYQDSFYKLVVFVPESHFEQLRNALSEEGAGHIGKYSHCTFSTLGEGTFKPLENTNPYIGEQGQLEKVKEIRLETIVPKSKLKNIIKTMLNVHPYEEVAYDVFHLENTGKSYGIGYIGFMQEEYTLKTIANKVKEVLELDSIRVYGSLDKKIKKVAVSPGKGLSNIKNAIKQKADVFITGDIDYHTAIDALQDKLALIDAGHFGTEHIMVEAIINYLENNLQNDDIKIIKATEKAPYKTF